MIISVIYSPSLLLPMLQWILCSPSRINSHRLWIPSHLLSYYNAYYLLLLLIPHVCLTIASFTMTFKSTQVYSIKNGKKKKKTTETYLAPSTSSDLVFFPTLHKLPKELSYVTLHWFTVFYCCCCLVGWVFLFVCFCLFFFFNLLLQH